MTSATAHRAMVGDPDARQRVPLLVAPPLQAPVVCLPELPIRSGAQRRRGLMRLLATAGRWVAWYGMTLVATVHHGSRPTPTAVTAPAVVGFDGWPLSASVTTIVFDIDWSKVKRHGEEVHPERAAGSGCAGFDQCPMAPGKGLTAHD